MLKLKKMIALALFSIGIGVAVSAQARPGYDTCKAWYDQCLEGDETACERFDRYGCYWWDMS